MAANAHKADVSAPRRIARRVARPADRRRHLSALVVPEQIGPVDVQILASPRGDERLRYFTCGWVGNEAAAEVNGAARVLSQGLPLGGMDTTVIALTRSSGELLGWAGVQRRHLCEVPAPIPPGAYIVAIGTAWKYHGQRLDDGRRPGDALMTGVLEKVAEMFDDWSSPYTWARVLPDNRKSMRLFGDHGFQHFPRPHLREGDLCARRTDLAPW